MKKFILAGILIFSTLFSTCAADYPTVATGSTYYDHYLTYRGNGTFWTTPTKMNNSTVTDGLAIYDANATGGAAIASESMGYAMILAALYDDQTTFDKLSATVQAGISSGYCTASGKSTNLLPWSWQVSSGSYWVPKANGNTNTDSASDGDINIALGYIYASNAVMVYGWSEHSPLTYRQMATNYIQAIRLSDFTYASGQSTANKYILCGGANDAASGWGTSGTPAQHPWHPDYSDLRAYQLFATFDTSNASFWSNAIKYTKESWKAVFFFGATDSRTTQNANTGSLNPANSYVKLSNASYKNFQAGDSYTQFQAYRSSDYDSTPTNYSSDAARMPIRVLNFIQATENSGQSEIIGIGGSLLTSLGTCYTNNSNRIGDRINIASLWTPADGTGWNQDYTAAGLLALSGNDNLQTYYSNRASVESNLYSQFDNYGNEADPNQVMQINLSKAFNCSLALWGLTVYSGGNNPLQEYMNQLSTGIASSTLTSYNIKKTGNVTSVKLTLSHANLGRNPVKITLTSPEGTTVTVLNTLINGNLNITNHNITSFNGSPANGEWKLKITGARGMQTSSYLNITAQ